MVIDVMKNKYYAFSIRLNEEENNIIRRLKDKHGINISGFVKIVLRRKLDQLEGRSCPERKVEKIP